MSRPKSAGRSSTFDSIFFTNLPLEDMDSTLQRAKTLFSHLAILRGAEPVCGLTRALFYCSGFFFC